VLNPAAEDDIPKNVVPNPAILQPIQFSNLGSLPNTEDGDVGYQTYEYQPPPNMTNEAANDSNL